jgi:hypothetical protein
MSSDVTESRQSLSVYLLKAADQFEICFAQSSLLKAHRSQALTSALTAAVAPL